MLHKGSRAAIRDDATISLNASVSNIKNILYKRVYFGEKLSWKFICPPVQIYSYRLFLFVRNCNPPFSRPSVDKSSITSCCWWCGFKWNKPSLKSLRVYGAWRILNSYLDSCISEKMVYLMKMSAWFAQTPQWSRFFPLWNWWQVLPPCCPLQITFHSQNLVSRSPSWHEQCVSLVT